jgi:hypothetical protein
MLRPADTLLPAREAYLSHNNPSSDTIPTQTRPSLLSTSAENSARPQAATSVRAARDDDSNRHEAHMHVSSASSSHGKPYQGHSEAHDVHDPHARADVNVKSRDGSDVRQSDASALAHEGHESLDGSPGMRQSAAADHVRCSESAPANHATRSASAADNHVKRSESAATYHVTRSESAAANHVGRNERDVSVSQTKSRDRTAREHAQGHAMRGQDMHCGTHAQVNDRHVRFSSSRSGGRVSVQGGVHSENVAGGRLMAGGKLRGYEDHGMRAEYGYGCDRHAQRGYGDARNGHGYGDQGMRRGHGHDYGADAWRREDGVGACVSSRVFGWVPAFGISENLVRAGVFVSLEIYLCDTFAHDLHFIVQMCVF